MADETPDNETALEEAKAAAEDAAKALDAVAAEAAAELPVADAPAEAPVPGPSASTPEPEEDGPRANPRKVREGIVVSDAMNATVIVAVVERVRHPRYRKTVQRTKRLYVDDPQNTAKVGDRVRVSETRPISKLKRWRLTDVLERAR